ncbi:cell division protein FtsL [bacterium]|nr:cell division protein FtsL [bacterium]
MKIGRFWALMILAGLFALGMAWEASRFADLSAKARAFEAEQSDWIARNRKLEAEIAVLSSRERTQAMANRLGLKKALPEERLRVQVLQPKQNVAGPLDTSGIPMSSAKASGGDTHD